ncbi:MAG: hypothetical protein DWQ05_07915 [Calditrichaeota bacterium]|nr:MAG: hypothetical protein DWQ05_07915 [Calditrichota bacterium]
MEQKEFNTLDYVLVFLKWRKLIIWNFFIVSILAVIISFLLPKYYKSTAVFLPPSQSSGLTALIQNFSVDVLGTSDVTGDAFITILNSRNLREQIISKYDLMNLYERDYIEHTLKDLENNVVIEPEYQVGIGMSNINSIAISVIDKSPQRAQNMATDFLNLLEERIIDLNTRKAKNNRIFLELRVAEIKNEMKKTQYAMRNFQEEYGAVEITSQSKVTIEAAAQLKAEILALEVERDILAKNALAKNMNLKRINTRLEIMKNKFNDMYTGDGYTDELGNVLLPISKIPTLSLQYFDLYRNAEIQNKLFEMLVPLLEQAKIQEAKNIPVLKIVDSPSLATYKYKPKRLFIVIGIVLVSQLFCFLFIFWKEYLSRVEEVDKDQFEKISQVKSYFTRSKNKAK